MKKDLLFIVAFILLFIFFWSLAANMIFATQPEKLYWCHVAASGNQNTLHLPPAALQKAGHMDAQGNPLHAGDYQGECVKPTVTPNPTKAPRPTCTPKPTKQPEPTVTVTPTVTVEPSVSPEPTEEPVRSNSVPQVTASAPDAPSCPIKDIGIVANINVVTTGKKGELEVQWSLPANADKVHIEYGLQQQAQYALLETPNDGNEVIRGLTSGQHYWFRVAGVRGCGVGAWSSWFDPLVP